MHTPIRHTINGSIAQRFTPSPRLPEAGELVLWGAHGGAGTTTLTALLQPAWDMGSMPAHLDPRYPAIDAGGRPLLIACRCTTWEATLATAAVNAITRPGGHVAVLVITGDGWPETAIATARFRLLSGQVGAVVRMPFVPGLRRCDNPADARLPRTARRALEEIRMLTTAPTGAPELQEERDAVAASGTYRS
jgi:hypothetical protein